MPLHALRVDTLVTMAKLHDVMTTYNDDSSTTPSNQTRLYVGIVRDELNMVKCIADREESALGSGSTRAPLIPLSTTTEDGMVFGDGDNEVDDAEDLLLVDDDEHDDDDTDFIDRLTEIYMTDMLGLSTSLSELLDLDVNQISILANDPCLRCGSATKSVVTIKRTKHMTRKSMSQCNVVAICGDCKRIDDFDGRYKVGARTMMVQ